MVNSLISIVVPNYNHKLFLEQRLNSIFNQTFGDYEVILLDDASTDGSQEFLKSFRSHSKVAHLVLNTHNSGSPFMQWKKGISLATGEYIWIAESDDFCEPTFLEHLVGSLRKNVGVYYTQTIDVDEKGAVLLNRISTTKSFRPNIWRNDFELTGTEFINKYMLEKNVIPNASAVLFKRNLIDENIFSDNLLKMKMCGDWLFWIKLCEKSDLFFKSEPLNYFRNHTTITRRHDTKKKKKTRILEECTIRNYVFERLGLTNKSKNDVLTKKWFALHPVKSLFKSGFYKLRLPSKNRFSLLLEFLNFKLKK